MNFNARYGMASPVFLTVAYDVLRSIGSKDAVVKLSVGTESATTLGDDPNAIFHEGNVARAQVTAVGNSQDAEMAEMRAALLVVASEDAGLAGKMDLSDKDVAYLRLVCEGLNDAECAEKLGLSVRAIKSRKKSVLVATNCDSLSHAVKKFLCDYNA